MTKQIKVDDNVHENLMKVKEIGGFSSISDAIEALICGIATDEEIIQREPIAYQICEFGLGNVDETTKKAQVFDSSTYDITFAELKEANVGDVFECDSLNYIYYVREWAEVIHTSDDFVVIKVVSEDTLEDKTSFRLIGVTLF